MLSSLTRKVTLKCRTANSRFAAIATFISLLSEISAHCGPQDLVDIKPTPDNTIVSKLGELFLADQITEERFEKLKNEWRAEAMASSSESDLTESHRSLLADALSRFI